MKNHLTATILTWGWSSKSNCYSPVVTGTEQRETEVVDNISF